MKTEIPNKPVLYILLFLVLLIGCNQPEQTYYKSGQKLGTAAVSETELQDHLDAFKDLFVSRIKTAAADIDQTSDDPKIRKMTLLWRTRSVAALYNIFEQSESMAVLIDTWCLCIRLEDYVENGQASSAFGSAQSIAVNTSRDLEKRIDDLAREVLGERLHAETDKNVRSFALANPIQSGFSKTLIYATETRPGQPNPFESALGIPLSPFQAFKGVQQTPAAIYDFSNTTRHLTDVIEELPESTRWQLLMLLYEVEETKLSRGLKDSLEKLSRSSDQISDIIKNIPDLVEQVDKQQGQIQETLKQTQQTFSEARTFLDDSRRMMKAFSDIAVQVNQTAQEWSKAAQATESAIKLIKTSKKPVDGQPPLNLQKTAEAITEAARQIQQLNTELPKTLELSERHFRSMCTAVTRRAAFLIILFFALLVIYRIVCIRLKKKKTAS